MQKRTWTNVRLARLAQAWVELGLRVGVWMLVAAGLAPGLIFAADSTNRAAPHWAFQAPLRQPAPVRSSGHALGKIDGNQNPIDAFIQSKLQSQGLELSARADRRTLLRRVTFDLTGLPPAPEEMERFLSDERPGAYERAVDRLLASPRYGERWGRHWLDVARYADTKGYVFEEERRYPYSYTYRDWVVQAMNRDLPYDDFLRMQIAGDSWASESDPSPYAALGFLTLGRRFLNNPHDIIDDRLDVIFRGTQGLTVQCARCHDHKYDPISIADYYSLYGVLSSSEEPGDKPLLGENPNPIARAAYLEERAKRVSERDEFRTRKTEEARRLVRSQTADYWLANAELDRAGDAAKREEFLRGRKLDPSIAASWREKLSSWKSTAHPVAGPWLKCVELSAKGTNAAVAEEFAAWWATQHSLVHPAVRAALGTNPPVRLAELAERYRQVFATAEKAVDGENPTAKAQAEDDALTALLFGKESPALVDTGRAFRVLPTPDQQRNRALQRKLDELDATHPGAPMRAMALVDRPNPANARVLKRGNPGNPGDEVPRRALGLGRGAEAQKVFSKGSGRRELADSLTDASNPLTARVWINRVWLRHFGAPLVKTPSDFGVRSDPPTHPELLDWLAVWFVENGWSTKALQRLMVTSHAYCQSSDPGADDSVGRQLSLEEKQRVERAGRVDPGNTLYWRMNRKRLDFEGMRDSVLAVSGRLDDSMGGLPTPMHEGTTSNRRTLYGFIDRQNLAGVLRAFDFASPDTTSPMRYQTTVPQQALFHLNSPWMVDQARAFGKRAGGGGGGAENRDLESLRRGVRRAYALAFQRDPSDDELSLGVRFLASAPAESQLQLTPPESWSYGTARGNDASQRLEHFVRFETFRDRQWRGGEKLPLDDDRGWAFLDGRGGHTARGVGVAVVRRWTAPRDGAIAVRGQLEHSETKGDGVRARIYQHGPSARSSGDAGGLLGEWTVQNSKVTTALTAVPVKRGETIDFAVDNRGTDAHDTFRWAPEIEWVPAAGESGEGVRLWSAARDFGGPIPSVAPLDPWSRYAQALLASNEFLFVD